MKQRWMPLGLAVFIIFLDQYTKYLIKSHLYLGEVIPVVRGFFNIIFVKNAGVAFGMGAETFPIIKILFFLLLPVLACIWLIYLIWTLKGNRFLSRLAYSLILGGAIGNLIDRFKDGAVVDFFDFYLSEYHFATFNIADSAITIAAFCLLLEYIIDAKKITKNV